MTYASHGFNTCVCKEQPWPGGRWQVRQLGWGVGRFAVLRVASLPHPRLCQGDAPPLATGTPWRGGGAGHSAQVNRAARGTKEMMQPLSNLPTCHLFVPLRAPNGLAAALKR